MLGAWGVFNLAATIMLLAHRIPGRRLQVATIDKDSKVVLKNVKLDFREIVEIVECCVGLSV